METKLKLIAIAAILFATSFQLNAQKKVLISTQDEIVEAANKTLEAAMKENGELFLYAKENKFTGTYIFDITIWNKGEVASVFVVENKGGNIPNQNKLKDYLMEMDMGFKMPKKKRYKFRYTFNFNN